MKLEKLLKILKSKNKKKINYVVPDVFTLFDSKIEKRVLPNGEVLVNPYSFYASLIEDYILVNKKDGVNYTKSLSKIKNIKVKKNEGGNWIKEAVLYSLMIRTSSSWDNDRSFSLDLSNFDNLKETGTFVKTLALLPFLKRLGVNTLYMLPISKYSLVDKKGELGSPYGVANFNELDPMLKSSLTGAKMTLDEEFKAFVEAAHILDMRVVIDIIPRTNSVCNDLIKDHPDWFYWIKASEFKKYRVPKVSGLGETIPPTIDHMEDVYKSKDVLRHIKMFKENPKAQNPELWESIKTSDTEELVKRIEKEFDLKIAPAFSDNINDIQAPWTDVTYFRMYMDRPVQTKKFLKGNFAPYILFDTIKTDMYQGKQPNYELWDTLSSIIPNFQKKYGIDGARIDMGHALSKELLDMIFAKAKKEDPDFAFIAEELNMNKDKAAKELGYNMIIGNGFWMEPRWRDGSFKEFVYNASKVALPLFACSETHDTPRAAAREGGRAFSLMSFVLNMFIPNTVPFINSGQEVYEVQPMNLGIDAYEKDRYMLDKNDLYYSKLALFDKFAIHYLNDNHFEIMNHLTDILKVRKEWLKTMINLDNYVPIHFFKDNGLCVGISYFNPKNNKCLLIIANTDCYNMASIVANLSELRKRSHNNSFKAKLKYATKEMPRDFYQFNENGDCYLEIGAAEVKVIEF